MGDKDGQTGRKQSSPASNDENEAKCPCGGEDTTSLWIFCDDCSQWLHCNCVGLKGLNNRALQSLSEWKCPKCIVSPYVSGDDCSEEVTTKGDLTAVCSVLKDAMKKELTVAFTSLKDVLKEAAESAVMNATPTVVSSVVEQTKSYAAAAKDQQKQLVEEVKSVTTSAQLVDKVCKKMDNDNFQRERRKSNIFVTNVPEPDSGLSDLEKKKADITYMCSNLDMERNEVIDCFRTGTIRKDENGNELPRPIVAKMMDEECASYYHDHGKGYKIGPCWINPDLCKVDRENQFFVRQERQRKKKESPREPTKK